MTRFEAIKNMSLEEMADYLKDIDLEEISCSIKYCNQHCPMREKCDVDLISIDDCYDPDCKDVMKIWLNGEIEKDC